jgi:hypothetical protein
MHAGSFLQQILGIIMVARQMKRRPIKGIQMRYRLPLKQPLPLINAASTGEMLRIKHGRSQGLLYANSYERPRKLRSGPSDDVTVFQDMAGIGSPAYNWRAAKRDDIKIKGGNV